MFLYVKGNRKFNDTVDIFISTSAIFALIFNSVVLVGYFCIYGFHQGCTLQPWLITYYQCSGITAILFFVTIAIAMLSSHRPRERCYETYSEPSENESVRYTVFQQLFAYFDVLLLSC